MIFDPPRLRLLSDCYLAVEFGDDASLALNARALAFAKALREEAVAGVVEVCPAMAQVAIVFDRSRITRERLEGAANEILLDVKNLSTVASRIVTIPVWYDDPWSQHVAERLGVPHNISAVATANGLTVSELVGRHSSATYWVPLVGFTPGANDSVAIEGRFAITAPKYVVPRTFTPARTIGCAGTATCIYPVASPGGYQMIGRAAVDVFVPDPWDSAFRQDGVLLQAGDRIVYSRIDPIEYDEIRAQTAARAYEYQVVEGEIDIATLGESSDASDPVDVQTR